MKTVIIGHRGTGKTRFLDRIKYYYHEKGLKPEFFDLDTEIEKRSGQKISEIFETKGEKEFRRLEEDYFFEILDSTKRPLFMSVGAGYHFEIPDSCHTLWLRRPTDGDGRIFLDRPPLHRDLPPLEDFFKRFDERQRRYAARADEELMLSEGFEFPTESEVVALGLKPAQLKASLTVLPQNFRGPRCFDNFVTKRMQWGLRYFELRDDLLSEEQLLSALEVLPENSTLLSFRKNWETVFYRIGFKERIWDWALELGPCPHRTPDILSLHERQGLSVREAGQKLAGHNALHLKLAVEVNSFSELMEGHRWWQEAPNERSFLPRSKNGRWAWYRLWAGQKMRVNFIREGEGSSEDQPYLLDWVRRLNYGDEFAAILGSPVNHSLTPSEQNQFFLERGMPVFAVEMSESDVSQAGLDSLQEIGMRAAAVTSPLKNVVFGECAQHDQYAQSLEATNTIAWDKRFGFWVSKNTDVDGLTELIKDLRDREDVAVWGGGGTRGVLKRLLPKARFYSARTGACLNHDSNEFEPRAVVWAVGRSRQKDCVWPPSFWQPEEIVDLNYTADSPGLEYAKKLGQGYISGRAMFLKQAEKQREFWSVYL